MTIEAPLSKSKRMSLIFTVIVAMGFGVWCLYDGYFNQTFINDHTNEQGEQNWILQMNRTWGPPLAFGIALLTGGYLFVIRNRKMLATDTALVINQNFSINYDTIQKIDKTYFKSKGFFDVYHKGDGGKEVKTRIDDRQYDNLQSILDHLVAQIT